MNVFDAIILPQKILKYKLTEGWYGIPPPWFSYNVLCDTILKFGILSECNNQYLEIKVYDYMPIKNYFIYFYNFCNLMTHFNSLLCWCQEYFI